MFNGLMFRSESDYLVSSAYIKAKPWTLPLLYIMQRTTDMIYIHMAMSAKPRPLLNNRKLKINYPTILDGRICISLFHIILFYGSTLPVFLGSVLQKKKLPLKMCSNPF